MPSTTAPASAIRTIKTCSPVSLRISSPLLSRNSLINKCHPEHERGICGVQGGAQHSFGVLPPPALHRSLALALDDTYRTPRRVHDGIPNVALSTNCCAR